ncbi:MAG: cytochrome c biogenesis protein CcsA [Vicinamibacterales bacterium]
MLRKLFWPCFALALIMFATAPLLIARAPFEATMGLVQKIFYYHMPSAVMMLMAALCCGLASAVFLFKRKQGADWVAVASAELAVAFGLIALVTGPLWARKAWGVWWQWDARLTSTLVMWMVFVAYLLLRRFGGPGSDRLGAALALFGMANVPFVYWSVNFWRTLHPTTNVVFSLAPSMRPALFWSLGAFALLFVVLLAARVRLEEQSARLDALYLALDD